MKKLFFRLLSSIASLCLILLCSYSYANTSATALTRRAPIVDESVVFGERDGVICFEAEHFYKQSKNAVRSWYINGKDFTPNVKPDFDYASYQDAGGELYIEALPDTFVSDDDPAISGESVGDVSGSVAVLHYKINIDQPGRYYIWPRIRSNDEEDNTISAGINDEWPESAKTLQFTKHTFQWQWNSVNRLKRTPWTTARAYIDIPTAGIQDFQISMREDGSEVDRIVLTRDENFAIKEDIDPKNTAPKNTGPKVTLIAGKLPKTSALTTLSTDPAPKNPLANPDDSFYGAAIIYNEREGVATFEAENFYRQQLIEERMWHLVQAPAVQMIGPDSDEPHLDKASDTAYLELLPDARQKDEDAIHSRSSIKANGGEAAVLTYWVHFTTPGRYYVWIRGLAIDGDDNTLHIGINDTWPDSAKKLTMRSKTWTWNNSQRETKAPIYLDVEKTGAHRVQISMREDGCEIDKILLTQNAQPNLVTFDQLPSFIRKGDLTRWKKERAHKMAAHSIYQLTQDGLQIEVESVPATTGWGYVVDKNSGNSESGYSGWGYYRWLPEGQGIKPGQGILTYSLHVTVAGDYRIEIHSKIADPTNRPDTRDPDGNDIWFSLVARSEAAKGEIAQLKETKEWKKVAALGHPEGWQWGTHWDLGAPHPDNPVIMKLNPGFYELSLSGRSQGFQIDAIKITTKKSQ